MVVRVILASTGNRDATANTSGSRNGTRSSSELAMVILSALTRMSPRSQVNRSMCCMRATGSQPADSAYTGAVTSVWVHSGRKPGSTSRSCASEKLRALP